MHIVLAPILPERLEAQLRLAEQLSGSRRAEWEDYLRRYSLTRHRSWLAQSPAGPLAVIAVEGPGAAEMMPRFATSEHPFDRWFRAELEQNHGMRFDTPPLFPPPRLMGDVRA